MIFLCGILYCTRNICYDNHREGEHILEKQERLRVVVKVGTSTLIRGDGSVKYQSIDHLARALTDLKNTGHEIIMVSSGAIGIGAGKLGLKERPRELRLKQATAAVGQCEMMHLYDKFFSEYGSAVAQILLTGEDVDDPRRAELLSRTFGSLLELGCIPVVNENDSVSTTEIETGKCKVFGDNDTLSAIVARLCRADLLILLSDIDGLYDADPRRDENARLIRRVTAVTPELRAMAGGAGSWRGTGGMITKLDAAEVAMAAGVDMVITNGARLEELYDIVAGGEIGTRFCAEKATAS